MNRKITQKFRKKIQGRKMNKRLNKKKNNDTLICTCIHFLLFHLHFNEYRCIHNLLA